MMQELPLIKMFWYGEQLPALHQMCVASFLQQGHPVDLYHYGEAPRGVPLGVQLRAAEAILSPQALFQSSGGSYALFADQFRYELLHRFGGWWVDCDVYCVRPFDMKSDYVFGFENSEKINNAVVKCPPGCPLTRQLVKDAIHLSIHRDWNRAVLLFHAAVVSHGLEMAALPPGVFYPVTYTDWESIFGPGQLKLRPATRAVHLWGEMIRRHHSSFQPPFTPESPAATLWDRLYAGGTQAVRI